MPIIEEPYSDEIAAILTRATIASAIQQYDAGMKVLQDELRSEQEYIDDERDLLYQLQKVRQGLTKRRDVLARRQKSNHMSTAEKYLCPLDQSLPFADPHLSPHHPDDTNASWLALNHSLQTF